jgi:hypothetical protein
MIIRKFQEGELSKLIDFNEKVFNKRDKVEESILYRFFINPISDKQLNETLVAIDENDNLVGQILMMPAAFSFEKQKYKAFWGMDFFVNEASRNSLGGVILANRAVAVNYHFGIGFTEPSLRLFLAFNEKIVGYMNKYIKLNILFSVYRIIFKRKNIIFFDGLFPDIIKTQIGKFIRVYKADEIVTNTGFWNSDIIEFSRSNQFIHWRFFYYTDKYFVYKFIPDKPEHFCNSSYFVLRPIVWKGVKCILLVDYRFDINDRNMFSLIIKSAIKVSKKLKMAATIMGCSLPSYNFSLRKKCFIRFGGKVEIVTNFKFKNNNLEKNRNRIMVTFGDSDCDFYYGNDRW